MIGAQDFCGHYEWTFEYIRRTWGQPELEAYWREAIAFDSQRHAAQLFSEHGLEGMERYWGHTLEMEEAGYVLTRTDDMVRIDMHACPSKGYLIEHGLEQHEDYCAHCMGWIGPVAERAGFSVDHEHNHQARCWWELYRKGTRPDRAALQARVGEANVEHRADWGAGRHDRYVDGKPVLDEDESQSGPEGDAKRAGPQASE